MIFLKNMAAKPFVFNWPHLLFIGGRTLIGVLKYIIPEASIQKITCIIYSAKSYLIFFQPDNSEKKRNLIILLYRDNENTMFLYIFFSICLAEKL